MMDNRGVSVAVTHTITIGITTILIAGLIMGAGSMVDSQQGFATQNELHTTGDRIAADMVTAADRGNRTSSTVTVHTRYDSNIGGGLTVELEEGGECFRTEDAEACLVLEATGMDEHYEVPVSVPDAAIDDGSATGGSLVVEYTHENGNGEVTIRDR